MSTATESTTSQEILRPVLGERFVLSRGQLAVCCVFAILFVYFNYIPIFHSDIWCHVNYGEWMLDHGRLLEEDPFMPLAAGVRTVNNAWLSQVAFASVERRFGVQGLSNVFAVVLLTTFVVYARVFYLLTGRKTLTMLGVAALLAAGWSRHAIIRPEVFGGLFAGMLFWLLMRLDPWRSRLVDKGSQAAASWPRWVWLAGPCLFAAWANLHGSFAVGLIIVASHLAGVVVHSAWRHGGVPIRVAGDPIVRRWVWFAELCGAATLLNPWGLDLLIETARFGRNANLSDIVEWHPTTLVDFEGVQFLVLMAATLITVRFSRRAFHPAEVILLAGLTMLMASTVRMIGWLAPVWVVSMAPHWRDLLDQATPFLRRWTEHMERNSAESVVGRSLPPHANMLFACLVVWSAFALSPISQSFLSAKPREREQILSRNTPIGVSKFLRDRSPEGLVFAPQWWGDWLVWDGPRGMDVFMTSMIHAAPNHVWRDYMHIANANSGWGKILDRYAVDVIVIDKQLQPDAVRAVSRDAAWTKVFEDRIGVVFERRNAIATSDPDAQKDGRRS